MTYKNICWVVILSLMMTQLLSQENKSFEEIYKERITKTHINGFYIPTNLEDAMETMDETLAPELQNTFKKMEETQAIEQVFFSLGTWIGINWGLIEGSRYAAWMKTIHLVHPDDMIWFNLQAYHRHLNGKSLETEKMVKTLLEKRKKETEERLKKQKSSKQNITSPK